MQPQGKVEFSVRTLRKVRRVESVHHGKLAFQQHGEREVSFSLPLESTDYVLLYYGE